MSKLAELKQKYSLEGGNYEPNPSCKFCKGTGEKAIKDGGLTFCICLFVNHSMSDFAGDAIGQTARNILREMRGSNE